MKIRQIFIIFTILMGLVTILISWQICLPDGCVYNLKNSVCQYGGCFSEDIGSHLQERSSFFTAIINNILSIGYLTILACFLFLFFKNKTLLARHQHDFEIIIKHFSFEHNLFNFLFAKGILHPKTF